MNIADRLKDAYENVAFNSDKTWIHSNNDYQKANLKLHLQERLFESLELGKLRPRTVRDCIPQSRLAKYSNYNYDESRELSYSPSTWKYEQKKSQNVGFENQFENFSMVTEPWQLPEVDDLFKWLINFEVNEFNSLENSYESSVFKVNSLEQRILKARITEDKIKNIWGRKSTECNSKFEPKGTMGVDLFVSPFGNYFVTKHPDLKKFENARHVDDLEELKKLSESFKKQNNSISKFNENSDDYCKKSTKESSDVLYSEVLQGLTVNRKLHSFNFENTSDTDEEIQKVTDLNFGDLTQNQFSAASPPNPKDPPLPTQTMMNINKQQQSPFINVNPYIYNSVYNNLSQTIENRFIQTFSNPILTNQNTVWTSYVQETYFYSQTTNIQTQKFIPQNASAPPGISSTSHIPQFLTNWSMPNQGGISFNGRNKRINRHERKLQEINRRRHAINCNDGFSAFLPDNSMEGLEIEALEQYCNSNENIYQELEKQAKEQYE